METHENIANYGALIFFFGIIISFTSYYLLYVFGQLVENSDIIAAEYKRKNEKQEGDFCV